MRKRVIRIFKDIVERQPDLDRTAEILARIIRRVMDEEGVKKLVLETFTNLWFQPVPKHDADALRKKVGRPRVKVFVDGIRLTELLVPAPSEPSEQHSCEALGLSVPVVRAG